MSKSRHHLQTLSKAEERAHKRAVVRERIKEASAEMAQRSVTAFTLAQDTSSRKISGNVAYSAQSFVAQVLSQFNIPGALKVTYEGSDRTAGYGAHGITEGKVSVQVKILPNQGHAITCEVPVQVRNGYLLEPSILYHKGTPYVISQSAFSELGDQAQYYPLPAQQRHAQYAPDELQEGHGGLADSMDAGSGYKDNAGPNTDSQRSGTDPNKTNWKRVVDFLTAKADTEEESEDPQHPGLIMEFFDIPGEYFLEDAVSWRHEVARMLTDFVEREAIGTQWNGKEEQLADQVFEEWFDNGLKQGYLWPEPEYHDDGTEHDE